MKFAVVGTGVIGSGWITRILAHGHEVIATDPSENAFESMLKQVKQNWPYAEQLGLAENASLENLTFTPHLEEAVKDADHIQENVPEIESLKDQVLTEIDFYAKPDAIIGSSTSGIMPSELQKNLQYPERLVVAHPFHPVYILPLVEIVPGKLTTEETTVKAETIYESIGMDVLHVRHEIEGHVADRLMEALWREALHIVNDGIATTEEVDKAFTHAAGLRYAQYGPFMTFHLAGGEGGMRHMLKQFGPALKKPSLFEYTTTVKQIWVDHNGHMNDAEYNRVFSDATDAWLATLGLDLQAIEQLKYTIFTLENHVMYLKEIKVNESITVTVELFDFDAKRLHVFMTLKNEQNDRCATYEVMLMGMDTESNKPKPFPETIRKSVEFYADIALIQHQPEELGHHIGIKRK